MGVARAQQDDLSPPDMLLGSGAIPREHIQTAAISGLEGDGNSGSHAPGPHASRPLGIPPGIQMSDAIHESCIDAAGRSVSIVHVPRALRAWQGSRIAPPRFSPGRAGISPRSCLTISRSRRGRSSLRAAISPFVASPLTHKVTPTEAWFVMVHDFGFGLDDVAGRATIPSERWPDRASCASQHRQSDLAASNHRAVIGGDHANGRGATGVRLHRARAGACLDVSRPAGGARDR